MNIKIEMLIELFVDRPDYDFFSVKVLGKKHFFKSTLVAKDYRFRQR